MKDDSKTILADLSALLGNISQNYPEVILWLNELNVGRTGEKEDISGYYNEVKDILWRYIDVHHPKGLLICGSDTPVQIRNHFKRLYPGLDLKFFSNIAARTSANPLREVQSAMEIKELYNTPEACGMILLNDKMTAGEFETKFHSLFQIPIELMIKKGSDGFFPLKAQATCTLEMLNDMGLEAEG